MSLMDRLSSLFRRNQLEREISDELRFHVEKQTAVNIEKGMRPEEARLAALRAFGGLEQIKEESRDMRGVRLLSELAQDLRYGLRVLAKSPGFTAVAVLTLALGIGANTAIFSLIDAVMLRMLPVKSPQQLVLLNWAARQWPEGLYKGYSTGWCPKVPAGSSGCSFSYPLFEQIRAQNKVFSGMFAFAGLGRQNIIVNGQSGLAIGEMVSGDYFLALGVQPILGRAIAEADEKPDAPPVVVVSYNLWQGRFGGDPGVIGKQVSILNVPIVIIGVTPPEFFGLEAGFARDFWVPISLQPRLEPATTVQGITRLEQADNWWLTIMARLNPGVESPKAQADLNVLFRQLLTADRTTTAKVRNFPEILLTSGSKGMEQLRSLYSTPLTVLLAIVGLVLLIACANVANLLLARGAARQREMAVRLALGSGRGRLARQLLTESLLLASTGGAVGLLLAFSVNRLFFAVMSVYGESITLEVRPDWRVLAFTAGASAMTGVLFGLAPAWRGSRMDLTPALKASAGSFLSIERFGRLRLGKALVAFQVATSLLLLVGAGLFARTLVNLETEDLGFNRRNLLLFWTHPGESGYKGERLAGYYKQLLARLDSLSGVVSATTSSVPLAIGSYSMGGVSVKGYKPRSEKDTSVYNLDVGPKFFETLGIPLALGRSITLEDAQTVANVAVVNESFARQYFSRANPIGQHFRWGDPQKGQDLEIVGVAKDATYADIRKPTGPTIYIPQNFGAHNVDGEMLFEVRTAGDPRAMISAVRRAEADLDRNVPMFDVHTESEMIDETLWQERLIAKLSFAFCLLALLLAAVGLYGVMSYGVLRRTGEIGVRMALGARRGDVLWMVLRESLGTVAAGAVAGLAAAWGLTRFIATMLYGIKPNDPMTMAAASLLLFGVATLAAYLPARRASRTEPMTALRYE
jgi:predicted permease